jgi:hypothetical protein
MRPRESQIYDWLFVANQVAWKCLKHWRVLIGQVCGQLKDL